jgi:RNA polymerase sigma-70 factor (ECF subfamily)
VFGFLLALTRHRQDAEDLTQQAFIRGWRKIHRLDPARPVLPWLLTIARRESIVALRRRRPPLTGWPAADPWAAAAGDPPARRLWELAARTLPRDACAALWLHYREELPLDDVGRILGKRTGAVKTMLHRARTRLAQAATQVVPPPPPPPPLPAAGRHLPPPLPARWSAVSMP